MTMAARSGAAIIILFLTISPSEAGPCQDSIDRTQARIDAIIAKRAGQSAWRPESIDAMRGYQPTPRSIAAAEAPAADRACSAPSMRLTALAPPMPPITLRSATPRLTRPDVSSGCAEFMERPS